MPSQDFLVLGTVISIFSHFMCLFPAGESCRRLHAQCRSSALVDLDWLGLEMFDTFRTGLSMALGESFICRGLVLIMISLIS